MHEVSCRIVLRLSTLALRSAIHLTVLSDGLIVISNFRTLRKLNAERG